MFSCQPPAGPQRLQRAWLGATRAAAPHRLQATAAAPKKFGPVLGLRSVSRAPMLEFARPAASDLAGSAATAGQEQERPGPTADVRAGSEALADAAGEQEAKADKQREEGRGQQGLAVAIDARADGQAATVESVEGAAHVQQAESPATEVWSAGAPARAAEKRGAPAGPSGRPDGAGDAGDAARREADDAAGLAWWAARRKFAVVRSSAVFAGAAWHVSRADLTPAACLLDLCACTQTTRQSRHI